MPIDQSVDPLARAMPAEHISEVRSFLIPFDLADFRNWKSTSRNRHGKTMDQSITGGRMKAHEVVASLLNTLVIPEDERATAAGAVLPEWRIVKLCAVRNNGAESVVFDATLPAAPMESEMDAGAVRDAVRRILAVLSAPHSQVDVPIGEPGRYQLESEKMFGARPIQHTFSQRLPRTFDNLFWQDCRVILDAARQWNVRDREPFTNFLAEQPADDSGMDDAAIGQVKAVIRRVGAVAIEGPVHHSGAANASVIDRLDELAGLIPKFRQLNLDWRRQRDKWPSVWAGPNVTAEGRAVADAAKAADQAKLDELANRRTPMRSRLLHMLDEAMDLAERPDLNLNSGPLLDFKNAWTDDPPGYADGKPEAAVNFLDRLKRRLRQAEKPESSPEPVLESEMLPTTEAGTMTRPEHILKSEADLVPVKTRYPGIPPKSEPPWVHLDWIQTTASILADEWAELAERRREWSRYRAAGIDLQSDPQFSHEIARWQRLWNEVLPLFSETMTVLPREEWARFTHIRTPHNAERSPKEATAEWGHLRDYALDILHKDAKPPATVEPIDALLSRLQDYIELLAELVHMGQQPAGHAVGRSTFASGPQDSAVVFPMIESVARIATEMNLDPSPLLRLVSSQPITASIIGAADTLLSRMLLMKEGMTGQAPARNSANDGANFHINIANVNTGGGHLQVSAGSNIQRVVTNAPRTSGIVAAKAVETMKTDKPVAAMKKFPQVGILTVIGPELDAMKKALSIDDRHRQAGGGLLSFAKPLKTRHSGTICLQLHVMGEAGNAAAAADATRIIAGGVKFMLLCGIAGGYRDKVRIGDVVVPRVVVDNAVKVAEKGELKPRPLITAPLKGVLQMNAAVKISRAAWREQFIKTFGDVIKTPPGREMEYARYVAVEPELHESAILSDNMLMRDPAKMVDAANDLHQQIRASEMEAAGFVHACMSHYPPIPWFVIRGISDFCDDFKDDKFHKLASSAVASYAAIYLKTVLDLKIWDTIAGDR